jgi:hypothetical protein
MTRKPEWSWVVGGLRLAVLRDEEANFISVNSNRG